MSDEQHQHQQEDESSLFSALLYLFAGLIALVGVLGILSKLTGPKLALKGTPIPTEWMAIGAFFVVALIAGAIGFLLDWPPLRNLLRRHKWLWFVVFLLWAGSCAGTIHGINIWDAGGFAMYAAKHGDVPTVRGYLKKGELTKTELNKMLYKALSSRQDAMVEVLLKEGKANPNAIHPYYKKRTLFLEACAIGRLRMVQAFVNSGANLKALDKKGNNILSLTLTTPYGTSRSKRGPLVRFLINKGVVLKVHSKERSTAMYWLRKLTPNLVDKAVGRPAAPRLPKRRRLEPRKQGEPGQPPVDDGQDDGAGGPSPFDP